MNSSTETIAISNTDYAPFYQGYVARVHPGSIHEILAQDISSRHHLFKTLRGKDNLSGYAPGKWSVKQVIQHCMDTERIFSTRALMFARGETQNIPGYDHESYAVNSGADDRTLFSLKSEFLALRNSSRVLFESFSKSELKKAGTANDNKVTVQALAYIIPGHCIHHFKVLRRKYGLTF